MMQILAVTAPIYLVICIGFLAVRLGFFVKADSQVLGRFVLNFALPALLFNALASRNFEDVVHARYLAAYALGSLLAFGLMWCAARWWGRRETTVGALMSMGSSCSNSGYVGYPILLQLLGPVAAVGLAQTMLIENLLVIPLALSLAESGRQAHSSVWRNVHESFRRLSRTPMIWAIVLGFVYSMLGWHLPEVLGRTVNLFSAACAGLALFVNGGSLVGLRVQGLWRQVSGIAFTKLLIHPLSVALFLWLFGPLERSLQISGVVLAAMPMMGIYPLLAQRFGQEGFCAAALLVTTLASFVTISLLLWGMSLMPG